ncbi:MAG: SDR family oxidoreductase [Acidobacteria bacterium]|nr:SDR family oxidoreductase [Acidobacteriota bacterium]
MDGRVALITGGGAGIGKGTARVLAERGALVAIADIDGGRAEQAAKDIEALGGTAIALRADVAEEADVAAMVAATVAHFGRIDILHNNAAITAAEHVARDLDVANMEVEIWDRTMAVNLRGQMLGCKHAVPHMVAAGRGSIINTSSGSGLRGDMGRTAYGTSKAAIIALTKYVAAQYAPDGVRCNAIIPRASSSDPRPSSTEHRAPALPPTVIERMALLRLNVLGRPGTAEDVGRAVAFLASDDASWVTGDVLYVDGGTQAVQPWWSASRDDYEERRGRDV